jgi:hypothetical protein
MNLTLQGKGLIYLVLGGEAWLISTISRLSDPGVANDWKIFFLCCYLMEDK